MNFHQVYKQKRWMYVLVSVICMATEACAAISFVECEACLQTCAIVENLSNVHNFQCIHLLLKYENRKYLEQVFLLLGINDHIYKLYIYVYKGILYFWYCYKMTVYPKEIYVLLMNILFMFIIMLMSVFLISRCYVIIRHSRFQQCVSIVYITVVEVW